MSLKETTLDLGENYKYVRGMKQGHIIGVMGPRVPITPQEIVFAKELGKLIAMEGWLLLTGGMNCGVMAAVNEGAKLVGGTTIGILPTQDLQGASPHVDIPIITGMGPARNNMNVLTSHVIIACGLGPGTSSEISLAIAAHKPVILLAQPPSSEVYFKELGKNFVHIAASPEEAVKIVKRILQ